MATITLDQHMIGVGFQESGGALQNLSRNGIIEELTSTAAVAWQNEVISALETAGYKVGQPPAGETDIVLVHRNADVHHDDPTVAIIQLVYEHVLSGYQDMNNNSVIYPAYEDSLEQITTEVDRSGTALEVQLGDDVQGGEINPFISTLRMIVDGIWAHTETSTQINIIRGRINDKDFVSSDGADKYCWLCSEASAEQLSVSGTTPLHKIHLAFEFKYENITDLDPDNPIGWKPTISFKYEDGVKPDPGDLVAGTGYKKVEHYKTCDFNKFFNLSNLPRILNPGKVSAWSAG